MYLKDIAGEKNITGVPRAREKSDKLDLRVTEDQILVVGFIFEVKGCGRGLE